MSSPIGMDCEQCGRPCLDALDFLYYGSTKDCPTGDGVFRAIHGFNGGQAGVSCTDRWLAAKNLRIDERCRIAARKLFVLFSYYHMLVLGREDYRASERMNDSAARLIDYITTGKE